MDIDNQIISILINNFNLNHFINLGYDVKMGDTIKIKVKDLPHGSGLKIDVECNYCHKIFKKEYRRYIKTKNNICCDECKKYKMMETSLAKYGNICSLRNEAVLNKSKETNLKKLGVEYPFQSEEILKKCRQTCIDKYGDTYRNYIISKQQKYLHELYGGILNYNEYPYLLDIFFEEDKIYLEYDGSGHNLSIKLGEKTQEEFDIKEKQRESFLKQKGYKEFRIISNDDILPNDNVLLNIKERAFDILLKEGYNKYIYNLNTKIESFEK